MESKKIYFPPYIEILSLGEEELLAPYSVKATINEFEEEEGEQGHDGSSSKDGGNILWESDDDGWGL